MSKSLSLVLAAGLICSTAVVATAQPEPVSVTPAREAKAAAFARKHHPELAELLSKLKSANAQAYEKAIREVSQNSDRLGKMRENDRERYELSLRVWTLDSRIRLLAARSAMSDDPANEAELRALLEQRQDTRLAIFKLDRQRMVVRLERLDGQIQQIESDPEANVEADLARIKREITSAANRERRAANNDAAKKTTKPSVPRDKDDSGKSSDKKPLKGSQKP